jgi:hypothetical protein
LELESIIDIILPAAAVKNALSLLAVYFLCHPEKRREQKLLQPLARRRGIGRTSRSREPRLRNVQPHPERRTFYTHMNREG